MHNVFAIFRKQTKDTLKNKTVLIQFAMFPILTLVMSNAVKIDGMPANFFVNLFATMYIGMAPLTSIAAIISEEKENNTLRVLLMSNVKPHEYLLGIGSYVWLICMLGGVVICLAGGYSFLTGIYFMFIMAMGIIVSLLIGAAIGAWSKTQMVATSVSIPVMLVLSFAPMLSLFNTSIEKIAKYVYSEQISIMFSHINNLKITNENIIILAVNMLIATIAFIVSYKKCGLN